MNRTQTFGLTFCIISLRHLDNHWGSYAAWLAGVALLFLGAEKGKK